MRFLGMITLGLLIASSGAFADGLIPDLGIGGGLFVGALVVCLGPILCAVVAALLALHVLKVAVRLIMGVLKIPGVGEITAFAALARFIPVPFAAAAGGLLGGLRSIGRGRFLNGNYSFTVAKRPQTYKPKYRPYKPYKSNRN